MWKVVYIFIAILQIMDEDISYSMSSSHSILDRVAALLSLAPPLCMVSLFTLVLSRRDFATLCLVTSSLLNVAICVFLKNIIKDPRPSLSSSLLPGHTPIASDDVYGMPSNHTQLICFLASYVCLWAISGRWMVSLHWRLLLSMGCIVLSLLVAWSRIYLGHHSVLQVIVGAAIGTAFGVLHYLFIETLRKKRIFFQLSQHPVSKFLLIRDCSNVDVMTAEYLAIVNAKRVS